MVTLIDAGTSQEVTAPVGSSVQGLIDSLGLQLADLDRLEPPSYTLITTPLTIRITRVIEEFEVEESTIPFERQTVRNESLPEGESLLIQPGENGIQNTTYRRLIENGLESSRTVFRIETIKEARPEIVMIGIQSPFIPVNIPGKLAYLTAGNAWLMETTSGNRRPLITTGDLDGRVFSLSPNGEWLLYTRKAEPDEESINSLWVLNIAIPESQPIDLEVDNIIHFAEWLPDRSTTIVYSTVEPRGTAPGWQANNDLFRLFFNASGRIVRNDEIVEANSGGIYGWWGTTFAWSPDGSSLAYARPDSVGLVDFDNKSFVPLVELLPFQTRSDWAWVPGIDWSKDSSILYLTTHALMPGLSDPETSPLFDLSAFILENGPLVRLQSQAGMFAYPAVSFPGENHDSQVAFLEAIFPEQSETSRYRLSLIDQDGSNKINIFPPEGSAGLDPQQVVWSPQQITGSDAILAVIYQGNIWLIQAATWQAQQITGDGLITHLDWK